MSRCVIGIDADRQRLAVGVGRENIDGVYTIERMNYRDEVNGKYDLSLSLLAREAAGNEAVVFLEDVIFPKVTGEVAVQRQVKVFKELAKVQGELLYEFRNCGVNVRLVHPQVWQERILGFCKDREKLKAASAQEARRMLKSWDLTEHESDAACIYLYGRWCLRNEALAK